MASWLMNAAEKAKSVASKAQDIARHTASTALDVVAGDLTEAREAALLDGPGALKEIAQMQRRPPRQPRRRHALQSPLLPTDGATTIGTIGDHRRQRQQRPHLRRW